MAALNLTGAVPSPLTALEYKVLSLAREALNVPLSDDEQGFIELVEKNMHD